MVDCTAVDVPSVVIDIVDVVGSVDDGSVDVKIGSVTTSVVLVVEVVDSVVVVDSEVATETLVSVDDVVSASVDVCVAELVDSKVNSDDHGSVGDIVSVVELTGDSVKEVVVSDSVAELSTVESESDVEATDVVDSERVDDAELASLVVFIVVCSDDKLVSVTSEVCVGTEEVVNSEVVMVCCVLDSVGSSVTVVDAEVVCSIEVDDFSVTVVEETSSVVETVISVAEVERVSDSLLVDTVAVVEVVGSNVELSVDKVLVSPVSDVDNGGCSVVVKVSGELIVGSVVNDVGSFVVKVVVGSLVV